MENLQIATDEPFAELGYVYENAIVQIPQPVSFLRKVYISIDRT